tara:strand:- start:8147 stop:8383 length:237 start_codon:yes stop_codon:yes gene_type:complete
MDVSEKTKVIQKAKRLIKEFIDKFCNENVSFYVCQLCSTDKGYKSVEQFILQRMAKGDTIGTAINLKERILDPNRLVD